MTWKQRFVRLALTLTVATVSALAYGQSAIESFTYDPNGFPDIYTDRNGHLTDYDYDARGLEVSRTEALGAPEQRTVTTEWHPLYRLPTRRIEPGRETLYEYWELGDERDGQLRAVTVRDTAHTGQPERVTTYDWYANGLLKEVDGPRTDVPDKSTYDYDLATGNLLSVTDALGHVTEVLSHDAWGRPTEIRNPNGVTTTLQYHPRGWLRFLTVAGATTEFRYRPYGKLEQVIFPNGASLSYEYDAAQRVRAISDNLGNRIEYQLDTFGNAEVTEYKDPAGVLRRSSGAFYDRFDQLQTLYGGGGQQTSYSNDIAGNLDAVQNARGHTTSYADPDGVGRLRESTDALGGSTRYDFDALDNLTAVTDPRGNTTTYTVNAFGDVISENSPDRGVTSYSYDAAGNLTTRTDARGVTVSYSYDALNRLTAVDYPDDSLDVAYGYDDPGRAHGIGRLTSMSDEVGTTTYDYDARGNLSAETRTILSQTYVTAYGYDAADNLTAITYPSGRVVSYVRNAAGQITSVTTTAAGVTRTVAEHIAYLPFGPVEALDYGNGLARRNDFDLDYSLTGIRVGEDPTAPDILHLSLTPDPVGNIEAITDELDPARSQGLTYDPLDRLTDASGAYGLLGYRYDANGNRSELLQDGVTAETYAIDPAGNRLEGISGDRSLSYGYDAMGNVTAIGTESFVYDDRGRLVQAGGASYQYNGDGERVIKTAGAQSTVFHYDQAGNLIAETSTDASVIREYLYLDGRRLAMAVAQSSAPAELIIDNTQAEVYGSWPTSTVVAGYYASNYQYHAADTAPPGGIIVDNASAGFSTTGAWTGSTVVAGYYGANYQYHDDNGAPPGGSEVDNSDAGAGAGGGSGWNTSTSVAGYLGSNYQYHAPGNGSASFSWSLPVPIDGAYEVYARWTSHANRSAAAPYTIAHVGGSDTVSANQRQGGGNWRLLGTYDFAAGSATVTLNDAADGYVIADAVSLVSVGAAPNTATWTPDIQSAGTYEVYARWTAHPNRASNATYTVHHAGGATEVTVNQRTGGGTWRLLGSFELAPGANHRIELTDQADGYVIADAIELVEPGAAPNTMTYLLNVAQAGDYALYARWTAHQNRATNATYTVHHASGSTEIVVNQQQAGGEWFLLGTYTLVPGQNHRVELTDQADGYVIADAVRAVNTTPTQTAGLYYLHTDHLDTVQLITDQAGAIVWQGSQKPFGETETLVNLVDNPLRFPGQYYDQETGLHYNYFRDYDPRSGRYVQSDPIGFVGGSNAYVYALGNPTVLIDPLGLRVKPHSNGVRTSGTFARGFEDLFQDLYSSMNPYEEGSCEYKRREFAIEMVHMLVVVGATDVARSMFSSDPVVQKDLQEFVNMTVNAGVDNFDYIAGRYAANAVNLAVISRIPGIRALPFAAKSAATASASVGSMGYSSFKRGVKIFEKHAKRYYPCECD